MRIHLLHLLKGLAILLASILMGTLMMIAVYALPAGRIQHHLYASLPVLESEETYEYLAKDRFYTRLDNFTDAIMLGGSVVSGQRGVVDDAMNVYRVSYTDMSPLESLTAYLKNVEGTRSIYGYSRYWHGYQVLLRPLMLFTDYQGVRTLNVTLQAALLIMIAVLMTRRGLTRFVSIPLAGYAALFPAAVGLSIQFSTVFYVAFGGMALLLAFQHQLDQRMGCFFLMLGILTGFLDLLTYPLAAFALPLIMYLILHRRDQGGWIAACLKLGCSWGAGYVGMWAGKWAVGSILTGENVIANAMSQAEIRTSAEVNGNTISFLDTLRRNLDQITRNEGVMLLMAICVIFCLIMLFRHRGTSLPLQLAMALAAIILAPAAWYFVMMNHSNVHFWFTFRTLSVSICGMAALLMAASEARENNRRAR